jgi:hypothetical protein
MGLEAGRFVGALPRLKVHQAAQEIRVQKMKIRPTQR